MITINGFLNEEVRQQVNKASAVSGCLNFYVEKQIFKKRNQDMDLQNCREINNDICCGNKI